MLRQPRKLQDLVGYALETRDGRIGKLEEVYFDEKRWMVRYFVVHLGGWLRGRKALIVPAVINGIDEESRSFEVGLSLGQVENSPPIDTQLPVSRHYEQEYHRYYGWKPYWTLDPVFGPFPATAASVQETLEPPANPHLHSSDEVRGYAIHAVDGQIGHVIDLIVEEARWSVAYLEVDTKQWLPGRHVLIAPTWLRRIDWARREVSVDLTREAIETAPGYDRSKVISRDQQLALYEHYGMKFHES